jgi:hypothetical protein
MDYRELLPLDSFLNRVLLPAIEMCSRQEGRSAYDAIMSRLTLFEAAGWLSVGVEFGVFPLAIANAFCAEYFQPMYEQYRLFPSELLYLVPDGHRRRIRPIFEKGVINFVPSDVPHKECLSAPFEILLDLVGKANQDQSIRSMCTALLLLYDEAWSKVAQGVKTETILASLQGGQDVWVDGNRGFASAGVLHAIRHIESILELLDHKQRPRHIEPLSWTVFRQTVYDVHRWRFSFENKQYDSRFTQLTYGIVRVLNTEVVAGPSINSDGLLDYIVDLKKRWRALEQGISAKASS